MDFYILIERIGWLPHSEYDANRLMPLTGVTDAWESWGPSCALGGARSAEGTTATLSPSCKDAVWQLLVQILSCLGNYLE